MTTSQAQRYPRTLTQEIRQMPQWKPTTIPRLQQQMHPRQPKMQQQQQMLFLPQKTLPQMQQAASQMQQIRKQMLLTLPLPQKTNQPTAQIRPLLQKTNQPTPQIHLPMQKKRNQLLQPPKNPRPTRHSRKLSTKTLFSPNPFRINTIFTEITRMRFTTRPDTGLRPMSRLRISAGSRVGILP